MNWPFRLTPRASRFTPPRGILLAASCTLLLALSCSQNSYRWEGKEPPPPTSPRNAHVIHKEGSGMNALGSMEEGGAPAASQGPSYIANVALSREVEAAFKPGSTLFIIARSVDGNPTPVAAVKVQVQKFPVQVVITEKDSMEGGALPPKADIVARLDDDGDLTTQHPNDMASQPVRASAGEPFTVLLSKAPGK